MEHPGEKPPGLKEQRKSSVQSAESPSCRGGLSNGSLAIHPGARMMDSKAEGKAASQHSHVAQRSAGALAGQAVGTWR